MKYSDLIMQGWETVKANIAIYVGLTLVVCLFGVTTNLFPIFGGYISQIVNLGYMACLLKLKRGQNIDFSDFFWTFASLPNLIQSALFIFLTSFIVIAGFILLIIPGFWALVALSLSYWIFVTQPGDLDAIASIKKSIALVKGKWTTVAGFILVLGLLNLMGLIAFGVGVLLTIPVSAFAMLNLLETLNSNPVPATIQSGSHLQVNN